MNKLTLIFSLLLAFQGISQNFAIPIKDHPYFDIIEWKGEGGLLLSRSEKEFMNQINMSLIAKKDEAMWDQKFNPKVREPFYIWSENARHIYFVDNLDLVNNGRITFNQINKAGNTKSKILNVGIKYKALTKFDYNKFKCLDAAVTDKVLTYQYLYYDKKEKTNHEYAMFMTHHNLLCYVFELGNVEVDRVKKGINGHWHYAGFTEDRVYFAWREKKTDLHGWLVKGFSPKGLVVDEHFLNDPKNLIPFTDIGFGPRGKYYLEDEDLRAKETGVVSFINGTFYLIAPQKRGDKTQLVLFQRDPEDDEKWIELNAKDIEINEEEEFEFGAYAMNEGVAYHFKNGTTDVAGLLYFEGKKVAEERPYTVQSVYNPTSLLHEPKKEEFVTNLDQLVLICNKLQFGRRGSIGFEHVK